MYTVTNWFMQRIIWVSNERLHMPDHNDAYLKKGLDNAASIILNVK